MKQKIMSLVLVVLLMSTSSVYAAATPALRGTSTELTELQPIVVYLLEAIQNESSEYNLGNVNFDNLYLGEKITSYQELNNDLKKLGIEYYPIMEKNKVVAIATVSYTKTGEPAVQIGKDFSNNLQDFMNDNKSVALVYDENGETLYACNNDRYAVVDTFAPRTDAAVNAESSQPFDGCKGKDITYSNVKPALELDIEKNKDLSFNSLKLHTLVASTAKPNLLAASSSTNYKSLNVPLKSQQGEAICWAACVASIGQYVTGTNLTAKGVCDQLGLSYAEASMATARSALNSIYSITGTKHNSAPTFTTIMSELNADDPIWAGFSYSSSIGHAVVIRGYTSGSTYASFSYMDSDSVSYKVGIVVSDGTYQITAGGYTMTCSKYMSI